MTSIKGLDDHLTTQPESADPVHWHVSRHRSDDDVFIVEDFWSALDYAQTELRDVVDFEWEGISASGEAGDFEGAYHAFKRANELDAVRNQINHAMDQHYGPHTVRAPCYQGPGGDALIKQTADRAVEQLNSETDMEMWECSAELIYLTDTGSLPADPDNGIPYHADDYLP